MSQEQTKHNRRSKSLKSRIRQLFQGKPTKGKVKRESQLLQEAEVLVQHKAGTSQAVFVSPVSDEQLENFENLQQELWNGFRKTSPQIPEWQQTTEELVWDGDSDCSQGLPEVDAEVACQVKGDKDDETRSLQPENKDILQQRTCLVKNRNIHEVDRASVTPNNADTGMTALKKLITYMPEADKSAMLAKLRRRDLTEQTKATCNPQTVNASSPSNSSNSDCMPALFKKASTIYHRRNSVFSDGGIIQYPRNIPSPIPRYVPDNRQQQQYAATGGRPLPITTDYKRSVATPQSDVTNGLADELSMLEQRKSKARMQETFFQKGHNTATISICIQEVSVESSSVIEASPPTPSGQSKILVNCCTDWLLVQAATIAVSLSPQLAVDIVTRQEANIVLPVYTTMCAMSQARNDVPTATTTGSFRRKEMTSQLRYVLALMNKMVNGGTLDMKIGKVQLSTSEKAATLDGLEAICYDVCKPKKYQILDAILATAYVITECSTPGSIILYLSTEGGGRKLPITADDCEKFIAVMQSKVTNVPGDELLMSRLQEMLASMQKTFNQNGYNTAQTSINGQKAAVEIASVTKESSLTLTGQQARNIVSEVTIADIYRLKEMTSHLRWVLALKKKMVTDGTVDMKMGKVQLSTSERAATLDELEAICYDVCKPKKYQIPDAILDTAYVTTDCSTADSIIPYLRAENWTLQTVQLPQIVVSGNLLTSGEHSSNINHNSTLKKGISASSAYLPESQSEHLPITADGCRKFIAVLNAEVTNDPVDDSLTPELREVMTILQKTINLKDCNTAQTSIGTQKDFVETPSVPEESPPKLDIIAGQVIAVKKPKKLQSRKSLSSKNCSTPTAGEDENSGYGERSPEGKRRPSNESIEEREEEEDHESDDERLKKEDTLDNPEDRKSTDEQDNSRWSGNGACEDASSGGGREEPADGEDGNESQVEDAKSVNTRSQGSKDGAFEADIGGSGMMPNKANNRTGDQRDGGKRRARRSEIGESKVEERDHKIMRTEKTTGIHHAQQAPTRQTPGDVNHQVQTIPNPQLDTRSSNPQRIMALAYPGSGEDSKLTHGNCEDIDTDQNFKTDRKRLTRDKRSEQELSGTVVAQLLAYISPPGWIDWAILIYVYPVQPVQEEENGDGQPPIDAVQAQENQDEAEQEEDHSQSEIDAQNPDDGDNQPELVAQLLAYISPPGCIDWAILMYVYPVQPVQGEGNGDGQPPLDAVQAQENQDEAEQVEDNSQSEFDAQNPNDGGNQPEHG